MWCVCSAVRCRCCCRCHSYRRLYVFSPSVGPSRPSCPSLDGHTVCAACGPFAHATGIAARSAAAGWLDGVLGCVRAARLQPTNGYLPIYLAAAPAGALPALKQGSPGVPLSSSRMRLRTYSQFMHAAPRLLLRARANVLGFVPTHDFLHVDNETPPGHQRTKRAHTTRAQQRSPATRVAAQSPAKHSDTGVLCSAQCNSHWCVLIPALEAMPPAAALRAT